MNSNYLVPVFLLAGLLSLELQASSEKPERISVVLVCGEKLSMTISRVDRGGGKISFILTYYNKRIPRDPLKVADHDAVIGFSSNNTGWHKEIGSLKMRRRLGRLRLGMAHFLYDAESNMWRMKVGELEEEISDVELVDLVQKLQNVENEKGGGMQNPRHLRRFERKGNARFFRGPEDL